MYVPDYTERPGSDGLGDYHTYAAHLRRKAAKAKAEAEAKKEAA